MKDDRSKVLLALMLTIGVAALDNTVVATAIPSIVRNLGGYSQFPWVFSVYLLTQAVTVPIYGRLSDMFGRKPVLFFGIALFLAGSVLSGVAWSMTTLIVFRGLQGLGAGAVQPIAMTIVGDLYSVEERARVQGYLSAVWGIAAVIGPALGGVLSQYASWRFIFYLNLPVGAIAAHMIQRHFHEELQRKRHRIDVAGALTLVIGMSAIILGLLQGDVRWSWRSPEEIAVFSLGAVMLISFWLIEHHRDEPIMPPWVFSTRTLLSGNLAGVAIGALLIGIDSYVPSFAQGVLGVGPTLAGFTLTGMSFTWLLGSIAAGRLYVRIDFRNTALIGAAACALGAIAFVALRQLTHVYSIAVAASIVGVGFGLCVSAVLVAVQSTVGWDRRGVVTGAHMFGRTIGSALGVAVFGSIANSTLSALMRNPPRAIAPYLPHSANAASLALGGSSAIHNAAALAYVRHGIFAASHHVFIAFAVVTGLIVITVAAMPGKVTPIAFDEPTGSPARSEDLIAVPVAPHNANEAG